VNWYFWEGGNYLDANGTKAQPQNYEYAPGISPDGEVGVIWRYDDYYQRPTSYMRFDVNGSQGMYNYEWNYAIQYKAEVNLVLLYSWNEYHERTALEPHEDFTIGNFSGVGITSYYAKIFENTSGVPPPPPPPPPHRPPTNSTCYIAAIVVVFAAVLISLLFFLFRKKHDKLLSVEPPVKRAMSNTGLVETPVPAVRAARAYPLILGIVSCGTIIFVYLSELVSSITSPWLTPTENFLVFIGLPVLLFATAGNSLVAYAIAEHKYGNVKGIGSYAAGTVAGVVIVGFVFAALFVLALLFSIAASGGQ
jgi:hypothetical protein